MHALQGRITFIANVGPVALMFRTNSSRANAHMVSNSSYSSVGLTLTWSMGRKLALHITFYHKVHVVMGLLDFGSVMN